MEAATALEDQKSRAGFIRLWLSTGAPAVLALAAWNAIDAALIARAYRDGPSRAAELFLLALAAYAPLVLLPQALLSLALRWRRSRGRVAGGADDELASWQGIAAGIAAAWFAVGILAARDPAGFLTSSSAWLDGSIALATAVAAGLAARRIRIEAGRSRTVARARRLAITGLVGLTLGLLFWEAIRDRWRGSARSVEGIALAAAAMTGGMIAALLLVAAARGAGGALRRVGRRGWSAIALAAGACILAAGAVEWIAGSAPAPSAAGASRPNVILIVADTLRADHVGCYGAIRTRTPALDALAARGGRVEKVYASASWTRPATASLLTGLYPGTHGLQGSRDRLAGDVVTIAEVFRGAGYATAGIVANPVLASRFGLSRGFDVWEDEIGAGGLQHHPGSPLCKTLQALGLWSPPETLAAADAVVHRAVSWLDGRPGKPFFLYLHFMDPHDPYTPPPPFDSLYGTFENARWKMGFETLASIMRGRIPVEPEDLNRLMSLYDGAISSMDDQIGRFLAALESRGLTKETLVFFTADHGEEFNEHDGLGHADTLYEELVRIPLIVEGPGVPQGRVLGAPLRSIDLAPTILESAGLGFPDPVEGWSFWGALSRGEAMRSSQAYMEEIYTHQRSPYHLFRSLTDGNLKIIGSTFHVQGQGPWRWELYDLASDPAERRDLASARPADVERLKGRLMEVVKLQALHRKSRSSAEAAEQMRRLRALGYAE